jgi:arylsulfatase A-like enzyme
VAALAGAASFWQGTAGAETVDLATAFSQAEVFAATTHLDFGTPEARPLLRRGFSWDESTSGRPFTWSDGPVSVIELYLMDDSPKSVTMECWPFGYPNSPTQSLKILLNGSPVTDLRLKPQHQTLQFALPPALQRIGANWLQIRYAYTARPADVLANSEDRRELAVAWQRLRVSGTERKEVAALEATVDLRQGRREITLPAGALLAYHMRLRPGSKLRFDSLRDRDLSGEPRHAPAAARLVVETDEEGVLLERVLTADDRAGPVELRIPGERITRIVLGRQPSDPAGLLTIGGAEIEIPDPAPAGESADEARSVADPGADEARRRKLDELRSPRANVLLYVIDTLRADGLGAYGNAEPVSQYFDRLAREGILFENALAVSSWTRPTVVSMFTGLQPGRHGVVGRDDGLAPAARTLAERLAEAGYRTAGFITNANVVADYGVNQGFAKYEWYPHSKDRAEGGRRSAAAVTRSALEWIARGDASDPFFAFLHVSDPHGPYLPPTREREEFASGVRNPAVGTEAFLQDLADFNITPTAALRRDLIALYHAEIAYVDSQLGALLKSLDALGRADDTLVIVIADHGEEFFEHGWSEHGKTLYAEQIRIPMVVRLPEGKLAGRRVEAPVQQIDLMPTILDLLGLEATAAADGRSLLPLLAFDEAPARLTSFASLDLDGRRVESVTESGFKLIETFQYTHPKQHPPLVQLFDLERDPGEQDDLATQRPVAVGYLRSKAAAQRNRTQQVLKPIPATIDAAVEAELRALGYVR